MGVGHFLIELAGFVETTTGFLNGYTPASMEAAT
jgi:hypothetical protein